MFKNPKFVELNPDLLDAYNHGKERGKEAVDELTSASICSDYIKDLIPKFNNAPFIVRIIRAWYTGYDDGTKELSLKSRPINII